MRPPPDHGSTKSAISSHCSSVKSPCADRHVLTMSAGPSAIKPDYAIATPEPDRYRTLVATIFRTASEILHLLAEVNQVEQAQPGGQGDEKVKIAALVVLAASHRSEHSNFGCPVLCPLLDQLILMRPLDCGAVVPVPRCAFVGAVSQDPSVAPRRGQPPVCRERMSVWALVFGLCRGYLSALAALAALAALDHETGDGGVGQENSPWSSGVGVCGIGWDRVERRG